jgi:hypothetical protein
MAWNWALTVVAISVSVAAIFPGGRLRRLVEAQAIVDESWALSGRRGRFEWPFLVGSGLFFYALWVGSTALGTVLGGVLLVVMILDRLLNRSDASLRRGWYLSAVIAVILGGAWVASLPSG